MKLKIQLILSYFKGAKRYFMAAVIASLITTVFIALTPQIFRFTIDYLLEGNDYPYLAEHLWIMALILVGVALFSGSAMYVSRYHTANAGENFAKIMRDALFAHVQKLPMKWHDKHQTGDIIQRCTSDVEVIRNFVVTQLLEVFRTVFLVVVSFSIMVSMNVKLSFVVLLFVPLVVAYSGIFYRLIARRFTDADFLVVVSFSIMVSMNVKLSFVVLLFVPLVVAYSGIFYRLIARRFTDADEAEGALSTVVQENATGVRVVRAFGREKFEMERFREKNDIFANLWIRLGTLSALSTVVQENVTGVRVVRAFGREKFEMERFREKNDIFANLWIRLGTLSGLYWGVGDLITGLQVVTIIVLGAVEAVQGTITVGEFIAFASYNTTLVWPIRGLGRIYYRGRVYCIRIL